MEKKAIESQIKAMIVSLLELDKDPESINSDDNLIDTIGLNSVDALELLLMVEEEFEIEIDDDDLNESLVSSVGSMAGYIAEKIGEA